MMRWVLLCVALLLAACSTTPPPVKDFAASGRFAARGAIEGRAVNEQGRFRWWRVGERAELELGSPLGETQLRMVNEDGRVHVELPDGSRRETDDPQALLLELTGLSLPVQSLRWWIEGRPDPALPHERRDEGFDQAGWQVTLADAAPYPRRLLLRHDAFELRLAVSNWE